MNQLPCKQLFRAILAAAAAGGSAEAAQRARMVADNVTAIDVKDCLQAAAKAASDEDLDAFIGCFAEKQQPRIRRKAAVLFVNHSIDLELLDSHLVNESEKRAQVAVKYRTTLTNESYHIVSLVGLSLEGGAWRIAREKVEARSTIDSSESQSRSGGQVFRFGGGGDVVLGPLNDDGLPADIVRRPGGGCANGRCGLPR
jgi:hypothetical protein